MAVIVAAAAATSVVVVVGGKVIVILISSVRGSGSSCDGRGSIGGRGSGYRNIHSSSSS